MVVVPDVLADGLRVVRLEGRPSELARGRLDHLGPESVKFMNSDPKLIRLFLSAAQRRTQLQAEARAQIGRAPWLVLGPLGPVGRTDGSGATGGACGRAATTPATNSSLSLRCAIKISRSGVTSTSRNHAAMPAPPAVPRSEGTSRSERESVPFGMQSNRGPFHARHFTR